MYVAPYTKELSDGTFTSGTTTTIATFPKTLKMLWFMGSIYRREFDYVSTGTWKTGVYDPKDGFIVIAGNLYLSSGIHLRQTAYLAISNNKVNLIAVKNGGDNTSWYASINGYFIGFV